MNYDLSHANDLFLTYFVMNVGLPYFVYPCNSSIRCDHHAKLHELKETHLKFIQTVIMHSLKELYYHLLNLLFQRSTVRPSEVWEPLGLFLEGYNLPLLDLRDDR